MFTFSISVLLIYAVGLTRADSYDPHPAPNAGLQAPQHVKPMVHQLASRAPSKHTYTNITPSPGASPIPITSQFQSVTSYVPQYALCPLSPKLPVSSISTQSSSNGTFFKIKRGSKQTESAPAFPNAHVHAVAPIAHIGAHAPYPFVNLTPPVLPTHATDNRNGSTASLFLPSIGSRIGTGVGLSPNSTFSSTPFSTNTSFGLQLNRTHPPIVFGSLTGTTNFTTPTPYTTSLLPASQVTCHTIYTPKVTPICHTVVPFAASRATITKCDQALTFSTQYGYTMMDPAGVTDPSTLTGSLQPYVTSVTTYWMAPWTALTSGQTPETVTEKICSRAPGAGAGQDCVDIRKGWQTRLTTIVSSTTSHVHISTTVPGPSKVVVETWDAVITELETTLELQTRLIVEVSTETMTTDEMVLGTGPKTREGGFPGVEASATVVGEEAMATANGARGESPVRALESTSTQLITTSTKKTA